MQANQSWNNVANWYDSLVGEKGQYFHTHVIFPHLLQILDFHPGQSVLDLACGQGAFCRELNKRHLRVTGVDSSGSLIERAKTYGRENIPKVAGVTQTVGGPNRKRFHRERKNVALLQGDSGIEYIVDDARRLDRVTGRQFDRIVSILAMQNIDPVAPVFERVSSLLSTGGTFTIVILHPSFRSPRITGWGEDTSRKLLYRRIDRYMSPMKIPIDMHPGKSSKQLTWTYHRPLQDYVELGRNAGFVIDRIDELVSDKVSEGKHAKQENLSRSEIPMFMVMKYILR